MDTGAVMYQIDLFFLLCNLRNNTSVCKIIRKLFHLLRKILQVNVIIPPMILRYCIDLCNSQLAQFAQSVLLYSPQGFPIEIL